MKVYYNSLVLTEKHNVVYAKKNGLNPFIGHKKLLTTKLYDLQIYALLSLSKCKLVGFLEVVVQSQVLLRTLNITKTYK